MVIRPSSILQLKKRLKLSFFNYSILRKLDGMLFFEADAFTVFMSLKTIKPAPITDEFRNLLARYMEARNYICFILL
jgi:acyl-CoA thioesterase FadM